MSDVISLVTLLETLRDKFSFHDKDVVVAFLLSVEELKNIK